jgi:hypothetical protein
MAAPSPPSTCASPELDTDEAVIRYVQSRRGAVGYVSESAVTSAVKVVAVR